jgi:multidrug efflux system membrane fusion protein
MAKTRTLVITFAVVALGATGAWYQFGMGGKSPNAAGKKPAGSGPVPVTLATAETRDMPLLLEVTGRTEASASVTLKARIDGQVQSVAFTDGQAVRAGEVLLQLDPADYQARLAQSEANATKSQAQLAKSRADLERTIALKAKGFVSDEKVGEMRTTLAATEASAKADAAATNLARLQLGYTTIRAPFAGTIGAKQVFPGSAVKVNDTTLAVVNSVQPLNISFGVPEKYLPQLRAGMSGKKLPRATVSVPGSPLRLEGEVRFLDNAVDASTGTIQLKAMLPNSEGALASGQLVSVSLVLGSFKNAVVIPAEAVQQGANGPFVYIAKEGAAELRAVRLAATQKGQIIIAEGLAAGEKVVTEGQLRLTPGAKLKPAGEGKPETDKKPAKS